MRKSSKYITEFHHIPSSQSLFTQMTQVLSKQLQTCIPHNIYTSRLVTSISSCVKVTHSFLLHVCITSMHSLHRLFFFIFRATLSSHMFIFSCNDNNNNNNNSEVLLGPMRPNDKQTFNFVLCTTTMK